MNTSESTAAISAALAAAQGELTNARKTKTAKAGSYSYGYAPLEEVLDTIRKPLSDNHLAITQDCRRDTAGTTVLTRLLHDSGEWIEYGPLTIESGPDAQAVGGAITYARRYAILSALGIAADDDDDGAGAQASKPKQTANNAEAPMISPAFMANLHATARAKGVTHDQMKDYAGRHYGISSLKALNRDQAADMVKSIQALPDVEASIFAKIEAAVTP